jgi:LytS/YehU family sensor histidine kinase
MSDQVDNKLLSMSSAAASVVGVALLCSVVAGVWNYSVGGTIYLASALAGLIGAATGWLARRKGRNGLNDAGFWLGLIVVIATVAMALWLMPTEVVVTEY